MPERLQKIIAAAGIASRREAETLILEGHVKVNGRVVTEMGTQADIHKDIIVVNGERLARPETLRTIMLYKPRGVLVTMDDPQGRRTVADLIEDEDVRLFPVGRLDRQSEGLLLLTNDGDLAQMLTHPSHGVQKIYHVEMSREVDLRDLEKLEKGIVLEDGPTQPTVCEPLYQKEGFWYKMIIKEGRNRQIRRMFEALGYVVLRLKRVQVGNLRIGDLRPGTKRALTRMEIDRLRQAATPETRGDKQNDKKSSSNRGRPSRPNGSATGRPARRPGNPDRAQRPHR